MIKNYIPFLLLLIVTLSCKFNVQAQDNKNSIELSPFYGLQTFSADNNTLKGNFFGLEGAYHISMADNKADWVKILGVRDISVSFSYRNLQSVYLTHVPNSVGVLGNYFGTVSKLDIVLFNSGRTDFLLTPGFGFGYATQTFYTNNNELVGSHINFTAQVGLKVLTPIGKSTRLIGGIDLYHYSNAAFKLPNEGINSINASIGIDQDIDKHAPPTSKKLFTHYEKSSFEFGADIGRRGVVQTGGGLEGPAYAANSAYQKTVTSQLYQSGLYLGYNYRVLPILSLRAGLDAVYYFKTLDTVSEIHHFYATYQELGSSYDKFRFGTSLGAELWLGRFSLPINFGHYIHYHYFVPTYDSSYSPPDFYWSFGARYYVNPWLAIEAKQYLHRTQADFAGLGLVVRLRAAAVDN